MLNLFRAEWVKISGNRLVVLSLIWIFPIVAAAIIGIMTIAALVSEEFRANYARAPYLWTQQMLYSWFMINNDLGRGIILAFTAFIFAGEYQWGTWKNIIPRRSRTALILNKFFTLGVFVVTAMVAMSLIVGFGLGIPVIFSGGTYGPPLTGEVLAEFVPDYLLQLFLTFAATMIAASYAALAGMVTRSILGGVIGGMLLMLAEQGVLLATFLISRLIPSLEPLTTLHLYTPSYNFTNIMSWVNMNQPAIQNPGIFQYAQPHSLAGSVAIIALWSVGLVALILYLFRRQDIAG